LGVPLWCQDEAGPYQAIPQPGPSWQPEGKPACQPHEYIRGGTAKLLTLFRPATGEVRARAVQQTTNEVLHPWLKEELGAILASLPSVEAEHPARAGSDWQWSEWGYDAAVLERLERPMPAIRLVLVWDNLAGHKSEEIVRWCLEEGILLLYTPIGGSWLNMAESVQRILVRRALAGQHPQNATELMEWLEASVRGWNEAPTPFEWGGKRRERRQRARERRHALGGSGAYARRAIARRRRASILDRILNGNTHIK
jgi:DDE superfamily endonuclease